MEILFQECVFFFLCVCVFLFVSSVIALYPGLFRCPRFFSVFARFLFILFSLGAALKNDCHRNTGSLVARNVLVSSYMNGYKSRFCNKEVLTATLCNNFIINGDFAVNYTLDNSSSTIEQL